MKLTAKQLEVLMKMNSGWSLSYGSGIRSNGHFYFDGRFGADNPKPNTVESLIKKKLIVGTKDPKRLWRTTYALTQAGRVAVFTI